MEELLASQSQKITNIYRGQEVEGEVVSISDKELILDLGTKAEGILPAREIPQSQLEKIKTGDTLKAFVAIPENEHGQIILSTSAQSKLSQSSFKGRGPNWSKFISALNQKSKLKGTVLEVNKGGLIVEVSGTRGFLPNSQVGFELLSKAGKGMENLIGQDLVVTVIEIDQDNNKLIFSERGQVSPEIKDSLKGFKVNQKVQGKVVAILPFGLVIDSSGVEGLVFISDVAWEKVDDLSKMFEVGQEVEVLISGIDEDLGRLNLSLKALSEDPFAKVAEDYPADEVVSGEVITINEAGVTVKLKDGLEGLLPSAKVSADAKYEIGQKATFLVDNVDMQRRKINLAPFVTSTAGLIYK